LKREKERRCSRGEEGNEQVKNVHEQMIHLNLKPRSTAKEGTGARGKGGRSTTPVKVMQLLLQNTDLHSYKTLQLVWLSFISFPSLCKTSSSSLHHAIAEKQVVY